MFVVSTVIVTTFIVFNVIPDFIFAFVWSDTIYHMLAFLWCIGYICDPLVYIFLSKKCRNIALTALTNVRLDITERVVAVERALSSMKIGESRNSVRLKFQYLCDEADGAALKYNRDDRVGYLTVLSPLSPSASSSCGTALVSESNDDEISVFGGDEGEQCTIDSRNITLTGSYIF